MGGAWCEDPNKLAISGGAQISAAAKDVAVRASWPHVVDPESPDDRSGWNVQVNAPPNVIPAS